MSSRHNQIPDAVIREIKRRTRPRLSSKNKTEKCYIDQWEHQHI